GLEMGKRALFAQQAAMTVTGHNISNANTEGFSRQRAIMKTTIPIPHPGMNTGQAPGQVGTGVEVTGIERLREQYLDRQYRYQSSQNGYWEMTLTNMEQVQSAFNEPTELGLKTAVDTFWESWQDLINEPESQSAREIVVQRGIALVEAFQHVSGSLKAVKDEMTSVLQEKTVQANQIGEEIRKVNEEIARLVPHGYAPNDLYDRRDLLVDQLSKLIDIADTPAPSGMVNITAAGQPLVVDKTSVTPLTETSTANSGEIRALQNLVGAGGTIDSYLANLDKMALTLSSEINALHQIGYDLNGAQNNLSFFVGTTADTLQVNEQLRLSPTKIAAAEKPAPGDSGMARQIAAIKFTEMPSYLGGPFTIDQFYVSMISKVGVETDQADRFLKSTDLSMNAIEQKRQSISGVSLDEEMTNMLKYQHAYNAASRSINAIDEMLDKLINGTGTVGR
ncbi:MAG: flagellar hook-associated protein FlgK, partial [Ignavibacteriales bacterium]